MRNYILNLLIVLAVLFTSAFALGATTLPATQPSPPAVSGINGPVVVISLQGEIDNYSRDKMFKRFADARQMGAKTVILQIDTYGGLVTAALDMSRFLKRQDDLHIIAYVDDKAISAGSMIAFACNEIVMAPGSVIGDCAPISLGPTGEMQSMEPAERAKQQSPILADFDESAIKNGHDRLIAQAMVAVETSVYWIENKNGERRFVDLVEYTALISSPDGAWKPVANVRNPIDGPNTLLTIHSGQAVELGLARETASTAEGLASSRGQTIQATLNPSFNETAVDWIGSGSVRFVLLVTFLLSMWIGFHAPGHGLAEAVCLTSLALLVGIPLLTGYAQWYEIVAIVVGIVLLALEIFVIPGFGVAGISGIVLVVGGLIMTFVPASFFVPGSGGSRMPGTLEALQSGMVVVVSGLLCTIVLAVGLRRFLPRMPLFNKLILTTTVGSTSENGLPNLEPSQVWPPVGSVGLAVTELKPGGSVQFRDIVGETRIVAVVSDGGYVARGGEVRVREVGGNRIVVRPVT